MKNKELFDKTVSILVKAYQNGTLRHTACTACAVGNMVAANLGLHLSDRDCYGDPIPIGYGSNRSNPKIDNGMWYDVVCNGKVRQGNMTDEIDWQIKQTGYTPFELAVIERAFENRFPSGEKDKDGYLGLMAVVDQLMLIHEANEIEVKEAKELFVKA